MFLIANLIRTLFVRAVSNRATAKAESLRVPAEKSLDVLRDLSKAASNRPLDIANLIDARNDSRAMTERWLDAETKREKWAARRDRVDRPSRRYPSYIAGKLDAAVAGALLYPYVPQLTAVVKGWLAGVGV